MECTDVFPVRHSMQVELRARRLLSELDSFGRPATAAEDADVRAREDAEKMLVVFVVGWILCCQHTAQRWAHQLFGVYELPEPRCSTLADVKVECCR